MFAVVYADTLDYWCLFKGTEKLAIINLESINSGVGSVITFFTFMLSVPAEAKPSAMLPFNFVTLKPSAVISRRLPYTAFPSSSYRTNVLKDMLIQLIVENRSVVWRREKVVAVKCIID